MKNMTKLDHETIETEIKSDSYKKTPKKRCITGLMRLSCYYLKMYVSKDIILRKFIYKHIAEVPHEPYLNTI